MTRTPGNDWSEEEHALLVRLWADGKSMRQISAQVGRSRCAVSARIWRHGLKRNKLAPNAPPEHIHTVTLKHVRLGDVDAADVQLARQAWREFEEARP